MTFSPTLTTFIALDLLTWHEQGSLQLSPKFQRRQVWQPAARRYFIDTILRGYPVPPLHIRLASGSKSGFTREVIDGQQRLRTLFDFIAGKFRLGQGEGDPWTGNTFDTLSDQERERVRMYKFHVYQYEGIPDETVLEIFSRINTYSVRLNKQELRNGKYFGEFKKRSYTLALEHLEFWRKHRIFTESAIARMQEAELTSELLILSLDGLQDKKNSIDQFYSNLDASWSETPIMWRHKGEDKPKQWVSGQMATERFRKTIEALEHAAGDLIPQSEFHRPPLFYSLFASVQHRLFGVPGFDRSTPTRPFSRDAGFRLRETMEQLSSLISDTDSPDNMSGWRHDFLVASARQTDNIGPRRRRLETIWDQARLGE